MDFDGLNFILGFLFQFDLMCVKNFGKMKHKTILPPILILKHIDFLEKATILLSLSQGIYKG